MLTRVGARDMRQDAPVKPVDVMPLAMIFLEKATVLTRNSTRSPSSKAAIAASAHAPAGARVRGHRGGGRSGSAPGPLSLSAAGTTGGARGKTSAAGSSTSSRAAACRTMEAAVLLLVLAGRRCMMP